MQTSEDVTAILQVQLDTSTKLYSIMKDISALSEPSKAYLRTTENLTEVLNCVRLLPDTSKELVSISADMRELKLQAEGMCLLLRHCFNIYPNLAVEIFECYNNIFKLYFDYFFSLQVSIAKVCLYRRQRG
jgi:hypothetical protein